MNKQDLKKFIEIIADKNGCSIQYNGCPCGTCFQSMENVDYNHLSWILLLALRGDYNKLEDLEDVLRKCLNGK